MKETEDINEPDTEPTSDPEKTHGFWRKNRGVKGWISLFAMVSLLLCGVYFLLARPYPYVINSPGPTFNVVGQTDSGEPVISIKGAKTHKPEGTLLMTTVSSLGGPGSFVNGAALIGAYFSSTSQILPEEKVYPKDMQRSTLDKLGTAQMDNSQEVARAVALSSLGYKVPAVLEVAEVADKSPSKGKVLPRDQLLWIAVPGQERIQLDQFDSVYKFLGKLGDKQAVEIGIKRAGKEITVATSVTGKPEGGAQLELFLLPKMTIPLEIGFHLDKVGGPSAGTMFALGIVDELTPGDMTGGKVIAGTGALSISGTVQPISGIAQKLAGAKRDGAQWFLAPAANCSEVKGNIPSGLSVVKISSFTQARQAVDKIAQGQGQELPSCPIN